MAAGRDKSATRFGLNVKLEQKFSGVVWKGGACAATTDGLDGAACDAVETVWLAFVTSLDEADDSLRMFDVMSSASCTKSAASKPPFFFFFFCGERDDVSCAWSPSFAPPASRPTS